MSQPYVCIACRQRLRTAQQRLRFARPQRWLSQAHQFQQERKQSNRFLAGAEHSRDGTSRRGGLGLPPGASIDGRHDGQVEREKSEAQSLRPEQLLNQLDSREARSDRHATYNSHDRRRPDHQSSGAYEASYHRRATGGQAFQDSREKQGLPQTLDYNVNSIVMHTDSRRYKAAWFTLLTCSEEFPLEQTRLLVGHKRLMRSLYVLNLNIVREWQHGLQRQAGVYGNMPSPTVLAHILTKLGVATGDIWASLLWRVASGIAATRSAPEHALSFAAEAEAVKQLMLLWNACTASQLQRTKSGSGSAAQFDWSFLPTASVFTSQTNSTRATFEQLWCMLAPAADRGVNHTASDYTSAALVTYDLLTSYPGEIHNSVSRHSEMSYAQQSDYQPFIQLVEHCRKAARATTVPPALMTQLKFAGDPTLAYSEAMVKRLGLSGVPEIRHSRERQVVRAALGPDELPNTGNTADSTLHPARRLEQTIFTGPEREAAARDAVFGDAPEEALSAAGEPVVNKSALITPSADPELDLQEPTSEKIDLDPKVHQFVQSCIVRLGRAMEQQDLTMAELVWNDVRQHSVKWSKTGSLSLPIYLYEHLMLTFLTLRRPATAIVVWNALVQAGLQATIRTWTVMMRGCQRGRDIDASESFWTRMRASGLQPDSHAWSIRLFGLVKAHRVQQALKALGDMGNEWIAAARAAQVKSASKGKKKVVSDASLEITALGDINGVPKPNIVIMNSAISALASKADEHIQIVLQWGHKFGVEPDLVTYNALLNVTMRHGQPAEALSILRRMSEKDIQPDSTTFTVLLTALFNSEFLDNLPASEQTEKIMAVVESVEASSADARLDEKGYALAIDRMLKLHNNPSAARAILTHMAERGIQPTAHIYTILMTSYFDAQPPNFDAAEGLWAQIQENNSGYGSNVDTIFYDRMVEAYAKYHAQVGIAPMMQFLERMTRQGKRPGWPALELVARALAERSDWARLAQLVEDVRNTRGLVSAGARGLTGQNEFWMFVISTGLLQREGITSPQQVRIRVGESSFYGGASSQAKVA